jgi:hypothetical protein
MTVDLWSDDIKKNPRDYKEELINLYTQLNYDKKNVKVTYIIQNIFKVRYQTEYPEDNCGREIFADPDEDGNYPIIIDGTPYLFAGKIIKVIDDNRDSQS